MSLEATQWAWSVRGLRASQRLVLLRLGDYADADGLAWPSVGTLAKQCEIAENTARDALHFLVESDLIWSEPRTSQRGDAASNRYRLNLDKMEVGQGVPQTAEYRKRRGTANGGVPQTAGYVGQTATHRTSNGDPPYLKRRPTILESTTESTTEALIEPASAPAAPARPQADSLPIHSPAQFWPPARAKEGGGPVQPSLLPPEPEPAAPPRKPKRKAKPVSEAPTKATWQAYCAAKREHRIYGKSGNPPVWNAKIGGMLAKLLTRIPAGDAPAVAAFFVNHPSEWYAKRGHRIADLLESAETLHEQWSCGHVITETAARANERTASNPGLAYLDELERERNK